MYYNGKHYNPPRLFSWLFDRLSPFDPEFNAQETLQVLYSAKCEAKGKSNGDYWYFRQVIGSIVKYKMAHYLGSLSMLKNYMRIAMRNLKKNRANSIINMLGLTLGLLCSSLILLWAHDEWRHDHFHKDSDRIYRAISMENADGSGKEFAVTSIALAPAIQEAFPEVQYAARTASNSLQFKKGESRLSARGMYVSPSFLDIFTIPFFEGHSETALHSTNTIVISNDLAQRLFGSESAVGKVIETSRGRAFTVSGVFKDLPVQSHIRFDYLIHFDIMALLGRDLSRWQDISFYTYLKLTPNADPIAVAQSMTQLHGQNAEDYHPSYRLQPLKSIYLDTPMMFDYVRHGSRQSVIALCIIALAILCIACINFVNLSTAKAARRAQEVGLRKVVGAGRRQLAFQFFGESMMLTFIAAILSFLLMILLLPPFNGLVGKNITLHIFLNSSVFLSVAGIVLFTACASGIYPALYLSRLRPLNMLRSGKSVGFQGVWLRKLLIVFQFALTIAALSGVVLVEKQLMHIRHMDLGYDKENLLVASMPAGIRSEMETFKQELLRHPGLLSATAISTLPLDVGAGDILDDWEGRTSDKKVHCVMQWSDSDYIETFKMKMAGGQFYQKGQSNEIHGFVINESAVRAMEMEDPIGKRGVFNGTEGVILGVVEDFHFRSVHSPIEPLILLINENMLNRMVIRLAPLALNDSRAMDHIKTVFEKMVPEATFQYSFLDERLNGLYHGEQLLGILIRLFTLLTLFVACIGLLGMAMFSAEQKTKEIGIRKVLGASVAEIFMTLCRGFAKWVLIANLFAWPAAYLLVKQWLQSFAVRTSVSVWVFLLAGAGALLIAISTVSFQTVKAARSHPVKALRYE